MVRIVRIRGPKEGCIACGKTPSINDNLKAVDYQTFCASLAGSKEDVSGAERIGVQVDFLRCVV